jgi:hypothetical protein
MKPTSILTRSALLIAASTITGFAGENLGALGERRLGIEMRGIRALFADDGDPDRLVDHIGDRQHGRPFAAARVSDAAEETEQSAEPAITASNDPMPVMSWVLASRP